VSGGGENVDEVLTRVLELVERQLMPERGRPFDDADADLRDEGLSSLGVVELMVELETIFGVQFPATAIVPDTFSTGRRLATVVRALRETSSSPG
jgi:acyl carrier protein